MKIENEEEQTIKSFIIILLIVVVIVTGLYFFTKYVVNKPAEEEQKQEEETTYINPTIAIVGTMLKKNEKEYYVLLTKGDGDNYYTYEGLLVEYENKKNALPVYEVNLSNPINSKFYTENEEEINATAQNIDDLKFGEVTVIKVKNGKITKAFTNTDSIVKEWKLN